MKNDLWTKRSPVLLTVSLLFVTEHFWFNFFEKVNKNIWQVVAQKNLTIFDFTNLFTNQKSKVD